MQTNWTKGEFKAYLLLYAASSDTVITDSERQTILEKISDQDLTHIEEELASDNDYQSIQKILDSLKKFNCSKEECQSILEEMKDVFMADGSFDIMERNMMRALKKLF